jgi:hypothetical protein
MAHNVPKANSSPEFAVIVLYERDVRFVSRVLQRESLRRVAGRHGRSFRPRVLTGEGRNTLPFARSDPLLTARRVSGLY